MIHVLLAEDQAMVRGALAALLNREPDIEVVAEVARGDEVVEAALTARPDVALLDIEMPGGSGLDAAQALQSAFPTCRSVILTRERCEEKMSGPLDVKHGQLKGEWRDVTMVERLLATNLAGGRQADQEKPDRQRSTSA